MASSSGVPEASPRRVQPTGGAVGPVGPALARIGSVNVGRASLRRTPEAFVQAGEPLREYRTAIVKSEVFVPAFIGKGGLVGDQQADTRNHGGADKAVHAHFSQHLRWWGERRGRPVRPGEIGENLTLGPAGGGSTEPDEAAFCIGDILAAGSAVLQVSQPRIPCYKQAQQLGLRDGVALAVATGRTGFYLRVLQEGDVQAGDQLLLLERPHPWATVAECNRVLHHARRDALARARVCGLAELSASVRGMLQGPEG